MNHFIPGRDQWILIVCSQESDHGLFGRNIALPSCRSGNNVVANRVARLKTKCPRNRASRRTLTSCQAAKHEVYEERVLEALNGAGEALATAYPMLERIAAALDVEEMLKEHAPEPPHVGPAVTAQAATKP